MEPLSFIHSSDWQIGMRLKSRLDERQRVRYADARIAVIDAIGRLAAEQKASFVLVAGDVYEHPHIAADELAPSLEAMGRIGVPVYLLPGNHDPLNHHGIWTSAAFADHRPDNVTVLDGTPIDREDCQIISAPWRAKNPGTDPVAAALADLAPIDKPRILVGHGMLDSIDPDSHSLDSVHLAPLLEAVKADLLNYVALGDRHIAAGEDEIGDDTGRIWYSGTPETTSWREKTRGTALSVHLTDRAQVTTHTVGRWLHLELERELTGAEDVTALDERLGSQDSKSTTIARVKLSGGLGAEQDARLSSILHKHANSYAALLRPEKYDKLVLIPGDEGHFGLSGFAAEALDELRESSDPAARDAIRLLYRLSERN
ncbi:MAG: metallophosphoesterase [Flaviflexus sp.]|nr:metallophosphoesterase [Flaviflexus sp.]